MRFSVLGSGSRGNCVYIESGRTSILIDGGFSGREIAARLSAIDRRPEDLSAILVTHEHNDHISGVGVLSRRFHLPVWANPATHRAASPRLGKLSGTREFATGESFIVRDLEVHPFPISHDTVDPVGFVVGDGRFRLACCTDTGRLTMLMSHLFSRCHGLILEANHDPEMLRNGPYPLHLQQRISSSSGHLANQEAAACVQTLLDGPLRVLVFAHLSETNNHPDLVLEALAQGCPRRPPGLRVHVARQEATTPLLDFSENFS